MPKKLTELPNGRMIDLEELLKLLEKAAMHELHTASTITLKELVDLYMVNKEGVLSPHTMRDYALTYRRLLEFLPGDMRVVDVTQEDIHKFLNTVPGGNKNKKNAHIGLSALWTFGVKREEIHENIVRKVDVAPPIRRAIVPFTRDEVDRLLKRHGSGVGTP